MLLGMCIPRAGCRGRAPALGRLILTVSLLLANGCANCGDKEEAAPPGKPEPPVVVHAKLPDGGRGRAKIRDLSERNNSPFEAGPAPEDIP